MRRRFGEAWWYFRPVGRPTRCRLRGYRTATIASSRRDRLRGTCPGGSARVGSTRTIRLGPTMTSFHGACATSTVTASSNQTLLQPRKAKHKTAATAKIPTRAPRSAVVRTSVPDRLTGTPTDMACSADLLTDTYGGLEFARGAHAGLPATQVAVQSHHVVDIPLSLGERGNPIVLADRMVSRIVGSKGELGIPTEAVEVCAQDPYRAVHIPHRIGWIDPHPLRCLGHQLAEPVCSRR